MEQWKSGLAIGKQKVSVSVRVKVSTNKFLVISGRARGLGIDNVTEGEFRFP